MSRTDAPQVLLLTGRMEARGSCGYSLRLVQRLKEFGIAATLVCSDGSRLAKPDWPVREYRRLDSPVWGYFVRWCLLRELRGAPPDLVHVQSRRSLALGSWLARRLERPYVVTVHDHPAPGERLRIDRRWCRKVIAVSESVADQWRSRLRLPETLVEVITAGVDIPSAAECSSALDPGHTPVVGTAGPLEAVKGVPYFLGAARRVLESRPELEFIVAGAGPEEGNLRRVARELGIAPQVTFVPYLNDFAESLAAMDIFCLPSLQQGLGTIMLEAMALGRPVIATGVGGVARVIRDGETGLTVPPQNSAALARGILDLLENPARARVMGAAARQQVVEDYDAGRMLLQTAELYREILGCAPKRLPLERN
ncbi:MAG: glycosyltransferase family 4 protein [Planctomycetales bacterium]